MNCYSIFALYFTTDYRRSCLALSPGFYPGFQVMGMIKGFFGRKIWQVFFWGGERDFFGYSKRSKDLLPLCCRVILQIKFNQLQTSARKFVVGSFGGSIFGPGIFLGFDFCLHSIIPITWNLEHPLGLYESNKANGALCARDERGEK